MKPIWEREPARETVPCDLCGGSDVAVVAPTDIFDSRLATVVCRRCGLVFTSPRMLARVYASFYDRDYRELYLREPGEPDDRDVDLRDELTSAEWRWERYGETLGDAPRLLDVGAGRATFCGLVRQRLPHAEVTAIEPDVRYGRFARERWGIRVVPSRLEQAALPPRSFSHAVMFHVLEHATQPSALLLQVNGLLRPDGRLLLEVPNIAGPWNGIGMLHPAHLYHFTPQTLTLLLQRTGFRVDDLREWDEAPLPTSISAIATKVEEPATPLSVPLAAPDVERVQSDFAARLRSARRDIITKRWKNRLARLLGVRRVKQIRHIVAIARRRFGR